MIKRQVIKPSMVDQITITIDLPKLTQLAIVEQFAERIIKICESELGIECIGVHYD